MADNSKTLLADGTEIFPRTVRRAPRCGNRFWIHSYISFVDGAGATRTITSAEFQRLIKAGWVYTDTLSSEVVALRQMNATTGFFVN